MNKDGELSGIQIFFVPPSCHVSQFTIFINTTLGLPPSFPKLDVALHQK